MIYIKITPLFPHVKRRMPNEFAHCKFIWHILNASSYLLSDNYDNCSAK